MNVRAVTMSFDYGRMFNDFKMFADSEIFNKELEKAEEDIKNKLLMDAKEDHRYTHRTKTLRNATKVGGHVKDKKYGLRLYVDLSEADYGKYVIRGHGKWAPDPFIDSAMENNKEYIRDRLQQAVDNTIKQMNRKK